MTDTPIENNKTSLDRPPVESIRDFVDCGKDDYVDLEVAIKEDGHVIIFHSHPFKKSLSWMEFDLETNKLDFILDDGDVRDVGMPLSAGVSKHMQNSSQILMVLMDPKTGEATQGNYIPLIIHRT